jgi:hypothetical protein
MNWDVLDKVKLWNPQIIVFWNIEEQRVMRIYRDVKELDLSTLTRGLSEW